MLEIAITWILTIISCIILMSAMIILLLTFLIQSAKTMKKNETHKNKIIGLRTLRISMFKVFLTNTGLLLLGKAITKLLS